MRKIWIAFGLLSLLCSSTCFAKDKPPKSPPVAKNIDEAIKKYWDGRLARKDRIFDGAGIVCREQPDQFVQCMRQIIDQRLRPFERAEFAIDLYREEQRAGQDNPRARNELTEALGQVGIVVAVEPPKK